MNHKLYLKFLIEQQKRNQENIAFINSLRLNSKLRPRAIHEKAAPLPMLQGPSDDVGPIENPDFDDIFRDSRPTPNNSPFDNPIFSPGFTQFFNNLEIGDPDLADMLRDMLLNMDPATRARWEQLLIGYGANNVYALFQTLGNLVADIAGMEDVPLSEIFIDLIEYDYYMRWILDNLKDSNGNIINFANLPSNWQNMPEYSQLFAGLNETAINQILNIVDQLAGNSIDNVNRIFYEQIQIILDSIQDGTIPMSNFNTFQMLNDFMMSLYNNWAIHINLVPGLNNILALPSGPTPTLSVDTNPGAAIVHVPRPPIDPAVIVSTNPYMNSNIPRSPPNPNAVSYFNIKAPPGLSVPQQNAASQAATNAYNNAGGGMAGRYAAIVAAISALITAGVAIGQIWDQIIAWVDSIIDSLSGQPAPHDGTINPGQP
jgi:hypothetical protein